MENVRCCDCVTQETTQGQIDGFFSQLQYKCYSKRWHLWEIDLRSAPGLPPGRICVWMRVGILIRVGFRDELRGVLLPPSQGLEMQDGITTGWAQSSSP